MIENFVENGKYQTNLNIKIESNVCIGITNITLSLSNKWRIENGLKKRKLFTHKHITGLYISVAKYIAFCIFYQFSAVSTVISMVKVPTATAIFVMHGVLPHIICWCHLTAYWLSNEWHGIIVVVICSDVVFGAMLIFMLCKYVYT